MRKFILAGVVGVTILASTASAAFAGEPPKGDGKCNSGRGNSSEPVITAVNDCDPGKSGLRNNGGD